MNLLKLLDKSKKNTMMFQRHINTCVNFIVLIFSNFKLNYSDTLLETRAQYFSTQF